MKKVGLMLAAALVALSSPTVAQSPADGKDSSAKDPNRMVCRTEGATGSRLGKKKICRTAAEWVELQAMERRDIERYQAQRTKAN